MPEGSWQCPSPQALSTSPAPLFLVLPVLALFLSPLVTCPVLYIHVYIMDINKHNPPALDDKFSSPITLLVKLITFMYILHIYI